MRVLLQKPLARKLLKFLGTYVVVCVFVAIWMMPKTANTNIWESLGLMAFYSVLGIIVAPFVSVSSIIRGYYQISWLADMTPGMCWLISIACFITGMNIHNVYTMYALFAVASCIVLFGGIFACPSLATS